MGQKIGEHDIAGTGLGVFHHLLQIVIPVSGVTSKTIFIILAVKAIFIFACNAELGFPCLKGLGISFLQLCIPEIDQLLAGFDTGIDGGACSEHKAKFPLMRTIGNVLDFINKTL